MYAEVTRAAMTWTARYRKCERQDVCSHHYRADLAVNRRSSVSQLGITTRLIPLLVVSIIKKSEPSGETSNSRSYPPSIWIPQRATKVAVIVEF